jgi:hypothetical protein
MSTITQRIPNFLGGISQQPDYLKYPGQLVDSINTYPDYALGLLKRPGGSFVAELYGANTSGRWFSILRDDEEKYVAQYSDNKFRVWSLLDGSVRAVDMHTNTGVPGTCNLATLKTRVADYNAAVALRKTRLAELNAAQATYAERLEGQNSTQQLLFDIDTTYTNDYVQSVRSGVILNTATNQYFIKSVGTVLGSGTGSITYPAGYSQGTERTDEYPWLDQQGFKVYELVQTVAAAFTAGQLATALSAMNTAQTNYNNAVSDEATKKGLYDTAVSNCNITTVPSNAYLKDATPDDIELLTLNDYTFVLNKAKVPAMKAATTAALPKQAFVVISIVAYNANYTVTLNGTNYTTTTPQDVTGGVTDSGTIATALATAINGSAGFTAVSVGPGIYITHASAFTVTTKGSAAEEGLYVFQDQIGSIGKLPIQCKDGYKVKVVNTADIEVDDMWVEFNTTNSQTYGPGVWEEANAPGITYELDELTMPHQLVRQSDGSFKFEPIAWEDRVVGDLTTNPDPSFIGSTIRNIFFYRNRLGFLSEESVVLSKAGDYFNFFATTAQVVTDDDPIDITATSTKPVTLNYVQNSNTGLVLFGQNEQFLLSTEATDILSPKTANLNSLSKYEADSEVESVNLGTSLAFLSKTNLYTRVFQLGRIRSDMPPVQAAVTTTVSELIPSSVDSMIASPALSMISIGEQGTNTLYQYKFYDSEEERVQSTWYKWEMTGNLLDQFFDISTFYAVVSNGTKVLVSSFDLTQASEQGYLTLPTGERTDVCLDFFNINPYRTYNSGTDQTTVYLPFNHVTGKTLSVIALGGYIGASPTVSSQTVGAILYPTVQGTSGAYYVVLEGDYRGRDLILGYLYDMTVEIPKIYPGTSDGRQWKADTTSSCIVHRLKIETGLSGPITYKVNITGLDEWDNVINVTLPAQYALNNVNLSASATHVVPIHQRNKNLRIRIIGDTPFPVTLSSMQWEGKYNTNFYTRR